LLPTIIKSIIRELKTRYRLRKAKTAISSSYPLSTLLRIGGFFSSSIGLGEAARKQARFIASLNIPVEVIDLTPAIIPMLQRLHFDESYSHLSNTDRPTEAAVTLFHMNPPELPKALNAATRSVSDYKIGYWVYELEEIPESWLEAARLVNEIWTPSTFSAVALQRKIKRPVHVMPLPLDLAPAQSGMRKKLGFREDDFLVLVAYSVTSCVERKNPYAAIRAFLASLGGEFNAYLIIKVSGLDSWKPARAELLVATANHPRVHILDKILTESEMAGLVEEVDVVLSMHRSEGYGLLLAEGMARGKTVVATGWSGNMDFMTCETSFPLPYRLVKVSDRQRIYNRGIWAEPDEREAAAVLRSCFENRCLCEDIGTMAKTHVEQILIPELRSKHRERIAELFKL